MKSNYYHFYTERSKSSIEHCRKIAFQFEMKEGTKFCLYPGSKNSENHWYKVLDVEENTYTTDVFVEHIKEPPLENLKRRHKAKKLREYNEDRLAKGNVYRDDVSNSALKIMGLDPHTLDKLKP